MKAILRTYSKITANDILARMICEPQHRDAKGDWAGKGKDPLKSTSCLAMRTSRWRRECHSITWTNRKLGKWSKDHIPSIMTPEMRSRNTTRGLKDMVAGSGELAEIELINYGSCKKKIRVSDKEMSDRQSKRQKMAGDWDKSKSLAEAEASNIQSAKPRSPS